MEENILLEENEALFIPAVNGLQSRVILLFLNEYSSGITIQLLKLNKINPLCQKLIVMI